MSAQRPREHRSAHGNAAGISAPAGTGEDLDRGLDAFIQAQLDRPHLMTIPGFGERLLKRGNLLFLLDGLDEVADPISPRTGGRMGRRWPPKSHPTCWFVVTSRFAGYSLPLFR